MKPIATCILFLLAVTGSFLASATAQITKPTIHATMATSKTTVYVNEPFEVTVSIYWKGIKLGNKRDLLDLPNPDIVDLGSYGELPIKRVTEGRQTRHIQQFKWRNAKASSPGSFTIAPTMNVDVLRWVRSIMGGTWQATIHSLQLNPITIEVKALPKEGKPANFTGSIGSFSLHSTITPNSLQPGDLVTATMTVTGEGHLEDADLPRLSPGRSFRAYDPKITERDPERVVIKQIIIPQTGEANEIAPLLFTFFDPVRHAYETLTNGPFELSFPEAIVPQPTTDRQLAPQSDIACPDTSIESATSREISPLGWAGIAIVLCMVAGIVISLALCKGNAPLSPSRQRLFASLLLVLALAITCCIFNAARKSEFLGNPRIILEASRVARIAPAQSAMASFEVPSGARVAVCEVAAGWIKIEIGGKRGWVPADKPVKPRGP